MSTKCEIEWFDNTVIPKIGSYIVIKSDIVNLFEDCGEDDDYEIETKSFPAFVFEKRFGGVVIATWNGLFEKNLLIDDITKWAYLPNLKGDEDER